MKKFVIARTWNGEGYSYENYAQIIEAKDMKEASEQMARLFYKNEDTDVFDYEISFDIIRFSDDEENAGTYQLFEAKDDIFGAVILCNINDVFLLNEEEYSEQFNEAVAQSDPQDEIDEENPFIGAYYGDFDYQFIKF